MDSLLESIGFIAVLDDRCRSAQVAKPMAQTTREWDNDLMILVPDICASESSRQTQEVLRLAL